MLEIENGMRVKLKKKKGTERDYIMGMSFKCYRKRCDKWANMRRTTKAMRNRTRKSNISANRYDFYGGKMCIRIMSAPNTTKNITIE